MSGSGSGTSLEIEQGMIYELVCASGERLFALAETVNHDRGTVMQLVLAVRLPEPGLWAPTAYRCQVSLEEMAQEARAGRESRA